MSPASTAADREAALRLWIVLSRAYRAVAAHARRHIEAHDLSPSEFGVLEALFHKGDLPIGEVGQRVLLTSGSMTYVIDKLERRKLLERRPCEEDQRVTYVRISAAGRALIGAMFPGHAEAIRTAMAGLDTEEKREAAALLKRLGLHAADIL